MKEIHNKNTKMKNIETNGGMNIEEILRVKFVDENKKVKQISKELNISYVTTIRWLKLAGIYSRKLNT